MLYVDLSHVSILQLTLQSKRWFLYKLSELKKLFPQLC